MTKRYPENHWTEELKSEEAILKKIFENGVERQHAIALWKLPGHREKHLIVNVSPNNTKVYADLEELPPGFILAPFINPDNDNNTFLKADVYVKFNGNITEALNHQIFDNNSSDYFHELFDKPLRSTYRCTPFFQGTDIRANETGKEQYIADVKDAIKEIHEGKLQKIVPSKLKVIDIPERFDIISTYQKLCSSYPSAFVSLVTIPGEGTWIGASPETLISIDNKNIFRTVALAGTQPLMMDQTVSSTRWSQKEIEEQALVSRYIINCFKHIRLREFEEKGPKTVAAGNLAHLKTEYAVNMEAVNFPQLGTVMLNLLHPTSAVCGMPKTVALNFISDHEDFDRSFYSGFLGPVNIENESHLFVNLRCMQFLNKKALLYAGAGVTEDSDPEKEWEETELKCQTMLDAISVYGVP